MPWPDCDLGKRTTRADLRTLRRRVEERDGRAYEWGGHALVVMHECDEPRCANPAHLRVGTQGENLADAWAKGRLRGSVGRGERHHHARLREADVHRIRRMADEGMTNAAIARTFAIDPSAISRVLSGARWSHVGGG